MLRMQAGTHFVFGLSRENITRLTTGEPIIIRLNDHGLTGPAVSIVLCYGETEEALALELRELIGPETTVRDLRRPHGTPPHAGEWEG